MEYILHRVYYSRSPKLRELLFAQGLLWRSPQDEAASNMFFTGFIVALSEGRSCVEYILHRGYCGVVRRTKLRGIHFLHRVYCCVGRRTELRGIYFAQGFIVA